LGFAVLPFISGAVGGILGTVFTPKSKPEAPIVDENTEIIF
jgi:hypothetical protein